MDNHYFFSTVDGSQGTGGDAWMPSFVLQLPV